MGMKPQSLYAICVFNSMAILCLTRQLRSGRSERPVLLAMKATKASERIVERIRERVCADLNSSEQAEQVRFSRTKWVCVETLSLSDS